jgi:signal transduction histidine kinase
MTFLGSGSLEDALKECAGLCTQQLGFSAVKIWIFDERDGVLILQGLAGVDPAPATGDRLSVEDEPIGAIARTGQPVVTVLDGSPAGATSAPGNLAGYPLCVGDRVVGVMALYGATGLAEGTHQGLLMLAQEIGLHIDRKRSEEALRAARDELEARVEARTAELRAANAALESSREQLRSFAAYLESVREEERAKIAREIHDELGQALTALRIDVSRLASRPPEDHADMLRRAGDMLGIVDATIQSVRRISTELRPGILDDLGLVAAIEWQAQEFESRTGILCQLTVTGMDFDLDRALGTTLFRIVQEALTNVARHAAATRVQVSLDGAGDRLCLAIRDNGRGMSDAALADRRSLGIMGMRERVRLRGGTLTIASPPGRGTTIAVEIPAVRRQAGAP